ncbi:MAG: exosortase H-associated membrane protein, partial [Wenzhouxiangellaceae bacterium]|nr:exosortase H-associated membrane protein [Wenzhouxiangellaceae bacterium]
MTQDDQEMQDREPAEADAPEAQADGDGGGNPVKEMFLLAALYLPLGFFLWFYLASALMWLPARLSELVLTGLFPNIVDDVVQLGFHLEVQTAFVREAGQIALADKNPMLYAWGMALLFGLIMATPLKGKRRALQMLIGYLVVSLVTVWGVVFDVLKDIAFVVQPEGPAA